MPIEEENIKGLLSKWGLAAKPCDSCNTSAALLYCRFDFAFLCISCDSKIHSKFSNHERVWICEVCEQAPAVVTCKADAAVLCSSCDRDIHSANPLAHRHERVPVVPFFETPADLSSKSSSLSSAFFVGDVFQTPCSDATTYVHDSWMIPNLPAKVAGADFIYSSDVDSLLESGSMNFSIKRSADSVVPIQAGSISLNHLNSSLSNENCFEIDFTQSKLSPFNLNTQCISQSISSSDVGIVPDENSNSMSEVSNFPFSKSAPAQPMQLSRFDREARVMRYREKRKNRKFEKTIRYASRKAYAEARPRIKGRFAKRTDGESELDQVYTSSAGAVAGGFLVDDDLYGVVPSF